MADIFIKSKKKKKAATTMVDKDKLVKESISLSQKIALTILAIIIAAGTYFFVNKILLPDMAIWAREIISLILSLLALAGFSAVTDGKSKISGSVVIFLFAIFIWQIVDGYSDYDFSKDETTKKDSSEVSVRTLYPREEPYVFYLAEVGDETEKFKPPNNGKHNFNFKSYDYGFEIINLNEQSPIQAKKGLTLPEARDPIFVLRAKKPKEYILVTVTTR